MLNTQINIRFITGFVVLIARDERLISNNCFALVSFSLLKLTINYLLK